MKMDRHFSSADEAVAFCRELLRNGSANLFRGQSRDWPTISPSLFRGDEGARVKAGMLLKEFVEWANAVPQMSRYWTDTLQLTAIAQHYGLPTSFLDLTTERKLLESLQLNPRPMTLMAKRSSTASVARS